MVVDKTIVLEERLTEMFVDLPNMSYDVAGTQYPIVFGYGDPKELNIFLKNKEKGISPYPLIWLLYPYKEEHNENRMLVNNAVFILAVKTNTSMENFQRLKETYKKVLFPLLDNFRYLFKKANIISTKEEYTITKYPNYSDTDAGEKHAGNFIWDALKVETSFQVVSNCYRTVNY